MQQERTWYFDANRDVAPASVVDLTRYFLWYLKAFLTGQIGGATQGLWTVVGSSDSVAGAMDGVDRWGSVYDGTKIVRGATTATARSWIAVRSPTINGSQWTLLLDFVGANDYGAAIFMFKGTPTGGSITARPALANMGWALGSNTDPGSAAGDTQLFDGSSAAHRFYAGLTSVGDFYVVVSKNGLGYASLALGFQGLAATAAPDPFPVWTFQHYRAVTRGACETGANLFGSASVTGGIAGRLRTGGLSTAWGLTLPGVYVSSSFNYLLTGKTGADPDDGSYEAWPLTVQFVQTTPYYRRGRIVDFKAAQPSGIPVGSVEPVSGPPYTFMLIGNIWFPAGAAPNFAI